MSFDPLRAALLAQAEAEAERLVAEAAERASDQVAQAEEQVAALIGHAREEGEAAAALETGRELARARREARALMLDAQREVYDELRREAHAAAQRLRAEPRYGALLGRLAEAARAGLGPHAELEIDPPAAGGVVARTGNRLLDYSLPALVDRCLAARAWDLERLWA